MDVEQPDLFADLIDTDELARSRDQVARLVSDMTRGLSRDRVADSMSALGCRTSTAMLNAWSSPARTGHNIPLYAAPIFELACRSTLLADWHVGLHNGVAFYGEDALLQQVAAELADLEAQRLSFTRRINTIRRAINNPSSK